MLKHFSAIIHIYIYKPRHQKTCFSHMCTTKVQISLRSLTSTFVVHHLDSIISILPVSKISRLATFCSWVAQFESYLVGIPEVRFSRDEAHINAIDACTCLCIYITRIVYNLSRIMTKPTKWLCDEQRLRSAWASAQSDQSLRCMVYG